MSGNNNKNKISAIAALILFYFSFETEGSLPLTETIYTIPEGKMTLSVREEIIRIDNNFRKDNYSIGIGPHSDLSIWYSIDYLHNDIINASSNKLGDSYLKAWFYLGNYNNTMHAGLLLLFRIPTGPNAYTENKWRNVSFGKNELKIGPVFRFNLPKSIFMHLNIFYVFRQGYDEGFYNGFYYNIFKKETYSNFFGLNFMSKDAFLSGDRLKNDYAICSTAFNTDIFFNYIPIIPFIEIYASHRVYKKEYGEYENLPIEGSGINPLLLSLGARYFIKDALLGIYYCFNPKKEKKFIKDIFGIDFSLQF